MKGEARHIHKALRTYGIFCLENASGPLVTLVSPDANLCIILLEFSFYILFKNGI